MFLIINQFEDTIEIGRLIVKSETPIFFYTEGVYLKFGLCWRKIAPSNGLRLSPTEQLKRNPNPFWVAHSVLSKKNSLQRRMQTEHPFWVRAEPERKNASSLPHDANLLRR